MRFVHFGIDDKDQIARSATILRGPFKVSNSEYLLPFNPVVTEINRQPSIAFFGYNAYCKDSGFSEAQQQQNFAEWCQDNYNTKLFSVLCLWQTALEQQSKRVAIYYTNFIKLVLREGYFARAQNVENVLAKSPESRKVFIEMAVSEVEHLKSVGCQTFICFGWAVYRLMQPVASATGIQLIREYHFSRHSRSYTERLLSEYAVEI